MREFFGFGGYQREPAGYFSWQHIVFVTCFMIAMVAAAVYLGRRNRHVDEAQRNKVLIWTAILIDSFEIFKIVIMCIRGKDPMGWITELPLFLCSIQLITIPLAAFSRGRIKEAALDFVFIFGILGAVLGTYFAGQNYSCYPVFSFDNMVSAITHSISGFASLYIVISGMESMKKKNIPITFAILFSFCIMAYVTNVAIDYNYMFLMRGDGTPYDIFYNLVGGSPVFYPVVVVSLFVLYICAFWSVYMFVKGKRAERKLHVNSDETEKEPINL